MAAKTSSASAVDSRFSGRRASASCGDGRGPGQRPRDRVYADPRKQQRAQAQLVGRNEGTELKKLERVKTASARARSPGRAAKPRLRSVVPFCTRRASLSESGSRMDLPRLPSSAGKAVIT